MKVFRRKMLWASLVASGLLGMAAGGAQADSLGIITVESTTIDDRFESKRDEPSNIGVISGDAVDASHVENIQQLLQGIPGLTTEVQAGDSIKIHIRGVENQVYMGEKPGVAVVIDGVPVFERTGRVNIDLDNIESIKVIKGGASYLFGDDALAGAVIITTKRGAKQAGYKLAGEAGSYGAYKGLARAGYANETSNGHAQISRRETDGYHDDSASRADYANGKLQYYLDDTSDLTFGFENSLRKKNSHGTVRGATAAELDPESKDPAYNDYSNRYDVRLGKYYLTYAKDTDATSNLLLNGYVFTDHTMFLSSPVRSLVDEYNYHNDYNQTQRGVKAEYRSGGESLGWLIAADLRANSYENETTFRNCTGVWGACTVGDQNSFNRTDEQVQAVYGELKFRVADPLTLTLNGRYDHIALDYEDFLDPADNGDKSFDVFSWRLGGNYAARENLDYYANLSTGFRAPTVEQMFVGSNSPTSRVAANPDLDPEFATNMEIGLRNKMRWGEVPVELDAAVFQVDRQDHIQATAGQYTTGVDNKYDNVGDVRHRGLELTLRSDMSRTWSWDAAYTYLNAVYTKYDNFNLRTCTTVSRGSCTVWATTAYDNEGNEVPRVPNHHLNLALHYRPASGWLITGEMDAISDYYADEINEVKIDGNETYNLLVNYDTKLDGNLWSFFFRIDNLLDDQYYNTARGHYDSNYDGIYDAEDISIVVNPGRVWTAGLSVQL